MLTDDGMAFADLPKNRGRHAGIEAVFGGHIFDRVCSEHAIEHRLTKPYHPWTNGQAERMNRTIKDATTKAFHYPDLYALKAHVLAFVMAYNFAKHLKALRWRTPFQAICDAWAKDPDIFNINPHHLIPGPNTEWSLVGIEKAACRLSRRLVDDQPQRVLCIGRRPDRQERPRCPTERRYRALERRHDRRIDQLP